MDGRSLTGRPFDDRRAIVLAGVRYDIGIPVVRWDHPGGMDGYTRARVEFAEEDRKTGRVRRKVIQGPRYGRRTIWGAASQLRKISQFLVHHSGGDGPTPRNMWETLYNRRRLSVHFAVEDTGEVFQFNDALDCCWHAGKHNPISVGVECCLYPLADERPDFYSAARNARLGNVPHAVVDDVIHGRRRRVFAFPAGQVAALAQLAAGVWTALGHQRGARGLPPLPAPPLFPRDRFGGIPRAVVPGALGHAGLIGHLQCTARKIDPAGFPWEAFEDAVGDLCGEFTHALSDRPAHIEEE